MAYCWKDIKNEKCVYVSRKMGSESVMIQAAFSFFERSKLCLLTGKQNAESDCKVLDKYLPCLVNKNLVLNCGVRFRQDNAPIHTAKVTRDWLRLSFMRTLDWLACSSDFNPIENVWGAILREVYKNDRQF